MNTFLSTTLALCLAFPGFNGGNLAAVNDYTGHTGNTGNTLTFAHKQATTATTPLSSHTNSTTMDVITIDYNTLKRDNWTAQEQENARLITEFVQHLMNNHDFDHVRKTFGNDLYVQHNRNLPEGLVGVVDYVEAFVKKYPDYTYDVKHIYADGNIVSFHSHVTIKKKHRGNDKKGLNIMDTWRIEDGKIVEHWDSIQGMDGAMRLFALMNGGKIRNGNGVF